MTLLRVCHNCGGDWPVAWFPWWGGKCRACRVFGTYFARVFNEAYWHHANEQLAARRPSNGDTK